MKMPNFPTTGEEITKIIRDTIYEGEIISEDDNVNVEYLLRIMARDIIDVFRLEITGKTHS